MRALFMPRLRQAALIVACAVPALCLAAPAAPERGAADAAPPARELSQGYALLLAGLGVVAFVVRRRGGDPR